MSALLPRNDRWSVFGALARRWRRWIGARADLFELDSCGRDEVGRMAQDLGMSASDLHSLASHGPDKGNLLQRRMAALHLDADELARTEPALLRDLQRLCTTCKSPRRCARDLKREPDAVSQDWRDYCPNSGTLDALIEEKAIKRLNRREEKRTRHARCDDSQ